MDHDDDIFDILMDSDNTDNVVLTFEDGTSEEFEQMAIIPHEDAIFAVLRFVKTEEDEDEYDEFLVMRVVADEEYHSHKIVIEEDEELIDDILDEFFAMVEEATDVNAYD